MLMLHGQLDLESYIKRLIESGRAVLRRAVAAQADRVAPGDVQRCLVSPQTLFKATHLSVSPECAPFFEIMNISAGKDSLFVTAEPFAATLFPPIPACIDLPERKVIEERLRFHIPIVVPGMILSLDVRNTSAEVRDFRGAFHGYAF